MRNTFQKKKKREEEMLWLRISHQVFIATSLSALKKSLPLDTRENSQSLEI